MIKFEATPYAAGVTIWGDYEDLRSMHDVIHEIVGFSPFREGISAVVLGLAYDIRKAYEMQREEKTFGFDKFDKVMYRGCSVLWPMLLFQVRLLRDMAAYGNTNKLQQSQLYLLESCIEKTLLETSPEIAVSCIKWLNTPFPINDDYYEMYVDDVARQYVLGPQGTARIKKLPELLKSLYPFSPEYDKFSVYLEAEAARHGCEIYTLIDNSEWPDFKW